jgi:hypothetical protein
MERRYKRTHKASGRRARSGRKNFILKICFLVVAVVMKLSGDGCDGFLRLLKSITSLSFTPSSSGRPTFHSHHDARHFATSGKPEAENAGCVSHLASKNKSQRSEALPMWHGVELALEWRAKAVKRVALCQLRSAPGATLGMLWQGSVRILAERLRARDPTCLGGGRSQLS